MAKKVDAKKQAADVKQLEDIWVGMYDQVAAQQALIEQNVTKLIGSTSQVVGLEQDRAKLQANIAKARKLGNKELVAELKGLDGVSKKLQQQAKANDNINKQFSKINDQAQDLAGNIDSFIKKLPGGSFLSKQFGFDVLGSNLESSLNDAASTMAKGGTASQAAGTFSKSLMSMLGPIGLIAVALGGLVAIFMGVAKVAKEITKETGLTFSQSKRLTKEANKQVSSMDNQLSLASDILDVQKTMTKEYGIQGMVSAEQANAISDMGKAFGYGAEEAAKVNSAFMTMGASIDDATTMQRELAAESMKAGVSVGTVMKDIAENSADVAVYFGGNTKELKKAAVEAAKLGVSLKTMKSVADGLLKFEQSITAQAELQALTGKQINLDMARQLALEGDIAGATKEVLSQVGDIHDFNNMDYLARKKLAEATGMSVDELQKSLVIQSKLGDLTEDQQAAMAGLGLSAAQMESMSADELQNRLAQQQAVDKTSAAFASIKATLVAALLPAAEALMGVFQAISPILKLIAKTIGVILSPITLLGSLIGGTTGDLSTMQVILGSIGGLMGIIYALNQKDAIITQGKLVMERAKEMFGIKETLQKTLINNAARAGLITDNQRMLGLQRETMIGQGNLATANSMNLTKNQGLATQVKNNAIAAYHWAAEKVHTAYVTAQQIARYVKDVGLNALAAIRGGLNKTELGSTIAINAQKAFGFIKDQASNGIMLARNVILGVTNALGITGNAIKVTGNISEGITTAAKGTQLGLGTGIAAAQAATAASTTAAAAGQITLAGATGVAAGAQAGLAAAALTTNAAMTFGVGTVIAIAAAGLAIGALAGYMMSGDDVMSPPTGGGGYGSRTLFGPEGAIAFNNKDTIVAGTDLFSQANDAMFAPKGALKMNDGAVGGDIKDPPEVHMVGIDSAAAALIGMGVATGLAAGMPAAMIAGFTAFTPLLGAMLMTTLPIAGMMTAVATMPMTTAAVTAGIIAGSVATALVPKPVLVLNPVLATFETNPLLMMGGILGGITGMFGGDKKEEEKPVTMSDVVTAISNIEITLDGKKVGKGVRVAESFGRGA